MNIRKVAILGGSGFVGKHLARVLCERGVLISVPTRNRERAKRELIVLPTVNVVEADVHSGAGLDQAIADADAVINLIGVLHARRGDFDRIHDELPAQIVAACRRAGIKRLIHMSALGADPAGPSDYLRSKGKGEARVMSAAGPDFAVTAFRPSVMFGLDDSFLTLFATLQAVMPMVLLGSPQAKFQPVWVDDVARAIADALGNDDSFGQRYDLCGPSVYSLRELVELAGRVSGHARPIVGLGKSASYLQALLMELSPVKILTRDNLRSMSVDNVCQCCWPELFDFTPSALEAVLPTYLAGNTRRGYDRYRARAGR